MTDTPKTCCANCERHARQSEIRGRNLTVLRRAFQVVDQERRRLRYQLLRAQEAAQSLAKVDVGPWVMDVWPKERSDSPGGVEDFMNQGDNT